LSVSEAIHCRYAGRCGGCPEILVSYSEQILRKKDFLQTLLGRSLDIPVHVVDEFKLRDRCDLTLVNKNGKSVLGLYSMDRSEIIDLNECPQMSDALWAAVEKLRQDLPPINLGSIRVRVSPHSKIGLWLDFPNQTIKELLDEKEWFKRILTWAYVEIGQKRKRLLFKDGKHQLLEDHFETWFETYLGSDLKPFSIYGKVGGFTQPGFRANKKLMQVIGSMIDAKPKRVLELCSGSGNFSFYLGSLGHQVLAVEIDDTSIASMKCSLENFPSKSNIRVEKVNLHAKNPKVAELFVDKDLVLADPPRSGLGQSLDVLALVPKLPDTFIYISCYPESFLLDIEKLEKMGYRVKKVEAVDQFPQSKHVEIIGMLELTND
jgi:23S rRNA (uracil1939-C5)-methyltransferase